MKRGEDLFSTLFFFNLQTLSSFKAFFDWISVGNWTLLVTSIPKVWNSIWHPVGFKNYLMSEWGPIQLFLPSATPGRHWGWDGLGADLTHHGVNEIYSKSTLVLPCHFIEKETEAQRGEASLPRSHSEWLEQNLIQVPWLPGQGSSSTWFASMFFTS